MRSLHFGPIPVFDFFLLDSGVRGLSSTNGLSLPWSSDISTDIKDHGSDVSVRGYLCRKEILVETFVWYTYAAHMYR